MYYDVIMAGFGGQGILMIGNVLSIAAIGEKKNVTYFPVYGVEMRGGTANCTVIVSDEEIGSPIVGNPMSLIAMNGPSLEKFLPTVKRGGVVVVNTSLIGNGKVERDDVEVVEVPANDVAEKVGSQQLASMVALGAFVEKTKIVSLDSVISALPKVISKRYEKLIPLNIQAIKEGSSLVRNQER
ncbi:MAG: 2-oxoacid:ferredoxin oxidoreductase subunit gamma [Deltaproteobacteria bacterium]|nr:MAG: 2-oxoacid:ferredoxin oxidoreductase subunit gamma [Deltaproteobacteria bacterium]